MNWLKHIFIKSSKNEELTNSIKKILFEKLYKFAKEDSSFAFSELNSKNEGLGEEEAKKD